MWSISMVYTVTALIVTQLYTAVAEFTIQIYIAVLENNWRILGIS